MASVTILGILEPKKVKSVIASTFPLLFAMKWWDQMPWSQISECWVSSQFFHSLLSHSSRGPLGPSSSLSPIRVVSPAYPRFLRFLPAILIPACDSSSPAFHILYSAYELNKQADNIQPRKTPFPIWNQSLIPCLVLMLLDLHPGFSRDKRCGLVFPSL